MAGMEGSADTGDMNNDHCPEEEDRLSLRSPMETNGRTPSDGAVKDTLGMWKRTLRESIRRVGEKSPLSSISKGSKGRPKSDTGAPKDDPEMTRLSEPPSPSEYCQDFSLKRKVLWLITINNFSLTYQYGSC